MTIFALIALPVVGILFVIYLVKLGERMENEKNRLEVAEAIIKENKKNEEIKEKLDIELARKRQSIADLLRHIGHSD